MNDDIEDYDSIEEYIREQMEDGIEVTAEDFEGRDCAHCGETIPFTEFPDGVVTWDVPVHDPDEPEPEPYYARYYYCSEECKRANARIAKSESEPDMIHEDDIDDERLIADGGTEQESEEPVFDYQPAAASRYDGDRECAFDDCERTADWLIDCKAAGYTGGKAFFCCQPCSESNRIYAKENGLNGYEVDEDLADVIPESEVEHVHDFQMAADAGGEASA